MHFDAGMRGNAFNWRDYNEHLVKRGEILIPLSALRNWKKELKRLNKGKRGRPFFYPNSLMRLFGIIRIVFRVPYRQLEGIAKPLGKIVGNPLPDYTTFSLRIPRLKITPLVFNPGGDNGVIAVDSTGLKATNRGEWMRRKKKGYVKLHIAIDVKTKQIIDFKITDEIVHDSKVLRSLVNSARKKVKIKKILADSGYDTRENYQFLFSKGIYPGIKPRNNAKPKGEGIRAFVVQAYREDATLWKREVGYGKRAIAESFFSAFKRLYGEALMARKWERIIKEIQLMIFFYNLIMIVRMKKHNKI